MSKDNILFTLIGVGFGLFFGFVFVAWANQRGVQARPVSAASAASSEATTDAQTSINHGEQQQLQAALQSASQRARENPQDFDAQLEAGQVSSQAQRVDDALEFLLKANQLRPNEINPVIQLGNVNYDAGRFEAAEKWYTAALVKEPDNINVRTDLGLTFLLRPAHDYDRAIAEFRRSLERDPSHEQSLQNLVVALTRKGDKAEARATLKRLQAVNLNNPAITQLQADLQ